MAQFQTSSDGNTHKKEAGTGGQATGTSREPQASGDGLLTLRLAGGFKWEHVASYRPKGFGLVGPAHGGKWSIAGHRKRAKKVTCPCGFLSNQPENCTLKKARPNEALVVSFTVMRQGEVVIGMCLLFASASRKLLFPRERCRAVLCESGLATRTRTAAFHEKLCSDSDAPLSCQPLDSREARGTESPLRQEGETLKVVDSSTKAGRKLWCEAQSSVLAGL